MGKDPAVLFYISNWLTATKGMKANAKGWFLNLILFQYELGDLPNDLEELANLCDVRFSEYQVFEQVFEQVLKQKFEQNSNGRLENARAKEIIQKRKEFKDKRSNAGKYSYLSRFINNHFSLTQDEKKFIKSEINFDEFDLKDEQVFKQVIEQLLELYINRNINRNIDKSKNIKVVPTFEEFKKYSISKANDIDLEKLELKYESWKENDWKDGNNNKIKNWKSKILNTLPYLKEENKKKNASSFSTNR
ncbi:DUF1376 domain-containing protein [Tenacibaculum sp. 190524A05c]|uniref:hypothetical protein n=1 Tax=Tenacibaculum platacis TaxID=3137852 RepID=UPI0031FA8E8E